MGGLIPAVPVDAVLAWGEPRLRDLPWRRTRDPWAVLVSEVMLQQTQVTRVIPAWHRFLERFPNPSTCAVAGLDEVLRLWHGLGYPRRARNLHGAAAAITRAGAVPCTLDGLLALPGVGPYTARAVLVFAFECDAAVVDTNIARVLARVTGARLTARAAQAAADALVPAGEGWVWNQVLMDLGATVCRPVPRCADCPLASDCAWAVAGRRGPDPAEGSAGVSARQAPYAGSDRQARGRLLARLLHGAVDEREALALLAVDCERAARVLDGLLTDGLVVRDGTTVRLPTAAHPTSRARRRSHEGTTEPATGQASRAVTAPTISS